MPNGGRSKGFGFKLKKNYRANFAPQNGLKGSFEVNKDYVLAKLPGFNRG